MLGLLGQDVNKIFAESIDIILAIWAGEPPYNIDLPDNRFKVSTAQKGMLDIGVGYMPKPLQQPRPEIVGTVVAPFSKGVIAMGKRDFHPLSANFLLSQWVKTHWANYVEGKTQAGRPADPADWRVARTVFVADDDKTADRYGSTDAASPYRFYYRQMMAKLAPNGKLGLFKTNEKQPDSEITLDHVLDRLVIRGSVNKVVDQVLALREEIGDFGEITYAGMDWVDEALGRRSMELMATQVIPRVNMALSSSRAKRSAERCPH